MKTYVLMVSKTFPKGHISQGKETHFNHQIRANNPLDEMCTIWPPKIHTLRGNYDYWEKRIKEVENGNACISVREWSGVPYEKGSTQNEICKVFKESGIGIQQLVFEKAFIASPTVNGKIISLGKLADNDGLELNDFLSWFESYDLTEPLAIIHFTKFRY